MQRRTKIIGAAAVAVVAVGGVTGAALAGDDDGTDQPITGDALQKASTAALAETGEGKVTETEINDEESYYEVEVTLNNGDQVDVQLDKSFNVVGSKNDGRGEDG